MGAHTGRRCRNSSASTTRRSRPPASSSAVAPPSRRLFKAWDGEVIRTGRGDVAVRRKMEALRRLIPSDGGGGNEVDELLLRAAGYIAQLQAQVQVMQLMVDVLEHAQD